MLPRDVKPFARGCWPSVPCLVALLIVGVLSPPSNADPKVNPSSRRASLSSGVARWNAQVKGPNPADAHRCGLRAHACEQRPTPSTCPANLCGCAQDRALDLRAFCPPCWSDSPGFTPWSLFCWQFGGTLAPILALGTLTSGQ